MMADRQILVCSAGHKANHHLLALDKQPGDRCGALTDYNAMSGSTFCGRVLRVPDDPRLWEKITDAMIIDHIEQLYRQKGSDLPMRPTQTQINAAYKKLRTQRGKPWPKTGPQELSSKRVSRIMQTWYNMPQH